MPLLTSRPSGLLAVHAEADPRRLQTELTRFDPRLFLTYELEAGTPVWMVLGEYAGDRVMPVCEWRDRNRRPLPLSSGLLELVRSLRPRGGPDEDGGVSRIRAENERVQERAKAEHAEIAEETAAEFGPRFRDAKRTVLPRSPELVAARRRQRARGENV